MRIYLSGPDGTGKSSIISHLREEAKKQNPVKVTWRRFGLVLTRILNIIARLTGWSYYEVNGDARHGYHNFPSMVALVYVWTAWIDVVLWVIPRWTMFEVVNRNAVHIADRYIFDIVADVIVSSKRVRITIWLFDPILKWVKCRGCCVVLSCPPVTVFERRPEVRLDHSYQDKVVAYKLLRRLYKINSVNTEKATSKASSEKVLKQCVF